MVHLKLQNESVLSFDIDQGIYQIYREDLLPFDLRDGIQDSRDGNNLQKALMNYRFLMDFFKNRSLSIRRENAKKILNALHISQTNDDTTTIKMMIMCKALSATDDYWITENPQERWENVNVRHNALHQVIAQISLLGSSPLTIIGPIRTPELTGQGAYAKAWVRENNELYLVKANSKYGHESEIEVLVSDILDCTNVPHVPYQLVHVDGKVCSKCKDICTDDKNVVSADSVIRWCNRTDRAFFEFVLGLDPENFYKTFIVDYLIANSDRHSQNWGFYMDVKTGQLLGLHPIFDHNNAFNEAAIEPPDGGDSLMAPGRSQQFMAQYSLKHCDFQFTKSISEDMFFDKSYFEIFQKRCATLGLNLGVGSQDHKKGFWRFVR